MLNYSEILDDTEKDVSESHSKLLDAVLQLDKGQRIKKAERSEPTLEVSEFHLVKSGISDRDTIQIHDLAKTLGKKGHHLEITKSLQDIKKKIHVLSKPLEKPIADKIKRIVGFKNTKQELKKWNAVITKNRTAESLQFPLNQSSMKLEPSKEFVKRFRLQSDLEKELAALEPEKENIEQKKDKFSLTLKEIIMKRKEAARIRAQQSYKEAKAHRQSKIKSKKFHRVQKKEKIKLQLKEFEELKKTNPEAALEKLEQLDRIRAEERMSLKHRNTGKWAKYMQIRAKYNKATRQELAQQLSISRDLTQKLKNPNDSDEEDEGDTSSIQFLINDKENPWMKDIKSESEIDEFVKSYRKYWDNQNNELQKKNLNINTNDNKEMNNSSKDKQLCNEKKNKNIDTTKDFFKNQNDENIPENLNKQMISVINESNSNSKVDNNTCNVQSFEIDNHKENLTMTEFNVENINDINNSYDKITEKVILNNDKKSKKKIELPKTHLNKVTATSNWNVESIENTTTKNVNSLLSNSLNNEKINKIFDSLEEKIQDQIESKLQCVTDNYDKVEKKRKKYKNIEFEEDNFDGLEIQAKKQKPILDLSLYETTNKNNLELNTELEKFKNIKFDNTLDKSNKIEIDPNKYMNIKPKHLNTDLPIDITGGNDVLDDDFDEENDEERRNIISEAFADDDVIEEFRKEKEEEVKKSQPKDIDLTLPGWGCWGGKNIKVSKRKKRRFILRVPKDLPRKDENKGDVIILEQDNPKIKEHQINELPYPFTSVKDYEASVRMPIGRNFVSENAHRKLIEPVIKTRIGQIIEPMNENVLVKKSNEKNRKFTSKKIGRAHV